MGAAREHNAGRPRPWLGAAAKRLANPITASRLVERCARGALVLEAEAFVLHALFVRIAANGLVGSGVSLVC